MIIETFKDLYSTIDNKIDNEKLEKVRDYILKNILDRILICYITDHINSVIENLFHGSNEKLKEDYFELRKLILYWYDDRYVVRSDKSKGILPIFKLKSSE